MKSPLLMRGCKIYAYARRSGPMSRKGSLSCHTSCDTGPRFFRSHPKDLPIQSPLTTNKRMWRIYSNPDPHEVKLDSKHIRLEQYIICVFYIIGLSSKRNSYVSPLSLQIDSNTNFNLVSEVDIIKWVMDSIQIRIAKVVFCIMCGLVRFRAIEIPKILVHST